MAEKPITEMTTKEFRAYVRDARAREAGAARRERHVFTQARWREAHPERLRETGRSGGASGSRTSSEEEREELRARDRERKRREREKS